MSISRGKGRQPCTR